MTPTILIIEDDVVIRTTIAEILQFESFNVLEADNGSTGINILQSHRPDFILCDINMPILDGYQVLQYIRENKDLANIPFMFLTAKSDRMSMRQGMNLGADDYITKPFANDELLSAIESRLKRYESIAKYNHDELDKAKQQLTHMVAHELRTPLTSVVMIEQLISRQIDALTKEQIIDLLGSWKAGAHRLHHVVEQMVLLTQIDSGTLKTTEITASGEVCNFWFLVDESIGIARQFAYRYPKGNIKLDAATDIVNIKCNAQSLRHALAEVIANALDFSPESETVLIKRGVHKETAFVSIIDKGPGLTQEQLARALTPFEQVDRDKQEQQGMGLGLPIAKKTVELHGGRILFRQGSAGGTQVIIQLPLHNTGFDF